MEGLFAVEKGKTYYLSQVATPVKDFCKGSVKMQWITSVAGIGFLRESTAHIQKGDICILLHIYSPKIYCVTLLFTYSNR